MNRVLIAADESEVSVEAARVAHRLFGDDAEYLVVHVGASALDPAYQWGMVYPATMPMTAYANPQEDAELEAAAEQQAAQVSAAAALPDAEAVGEVGDPVQAILDAAATHHADVIVVGSHERSWFSRLLNGSVSGEVVRSSTVPVLVVK